MQDGRPVVFVPRAEIKKIELARTGAAERPMLTGLVGAIILVAGLAATVLMANGLKHGGHFPYKAGLIGGALLFTGGWLLHFTLVPRLVLVVRTPKDRRKLLFSKSVAASEAEAFANQAADRFGCELEVLAGNSG